MAEKRTIKKYPNRRLYDTGISSYITLENVKNLVMNGIDFKVIDVKTNEDLTRQVLMQIISDQESGEHPIFSANTLTRIILAYGKTNQHFLADYLSQCLEVFEQQQSVLQEHVRQLSDSIGDLTEITEHNLKVWKNITDSFFKQGRILSSKTNRDN